MSSSLKYDNDALFMDESPGSEPEIDLLSCACVDRDRHNSIVDDLVRDHDYGILVLSNDDTTPGFRIKIPFSHSAQCRRQVSLRPSGT